MTLYLLMDEDRFNSNDYIMTNEQLHDFAYELGFEDDKEKINDCIEWGEVYPLLIDILQANGYSIREFNKPIALEDYRNLLMNEYSDRV